MSIKVMSWLWDNSKQSSAELLTLLALADWCNDEGFCWPGLRKIKDRARYKSMGGVYACLERLLDAQEIAIEYRGRTSHRYYLLPYRESVGLPFPGSDDIVTTSKQWQQRRKPKQRSTSVEHTGSSTPVEHHRSTGIEHQSSTPVETNHHLTVNEPSFSPNGDTPHENLYELYERMSKKPLTPVIVDSIKDMAAEHGETALREALEHVGSGGAVTMHKLQQALDGSGGVQVTPAIADYYHALKDNTPQEAIITNDMHYLSVAWSLKKNSAISADNIPALWQHVARMARDGGWSQYTIAAVDKYTNDYIAKRDGRKSTNTTTTYAPITIEDDGEVATAEERAAIRAAMEAE